MGKLCLKKAILTLEIDENQNTTETQPINHKISIPVLHENGYFIFLAKLPKKKLLVSLMQTNQNSLFIFLLFYLLLSAFFFERSTLISRYNVITVIES